MFIAIILLLQLKTYIHIQLTFLLLSGYQVIQLIIILFFFFSILLFSVYSIMYDELVLSCAQLRSGPFNLGYYGIFSSLVNGLNLVISQFLIPKLHITFGFQFFPI